ncbi:50S ribosomal protein L11 methyltransferase [Candidatus Daviesbacteria bacterium]|nr:50S ribosomal protein L11 methyltransferase [Candidatus Daviesbacteria bacterium]
MILISIQIILIALLLSLIYLLVYSTIRGGPYAPLGKKRVKDMINLLKIKKGEKAVDLGSGDGRVVIALAKAGAEAYGYEINPLLVWISRRNIKKTGLERKAFINWQDLWKVDLSKFDIVTLYVIPTIMGSLEKKLKKELKKGARVTSNHFKFPKWKVSQTKNDSYLYKN